MKDKRFETMAKVALSGFITAVMIFAVTLVTVTTYEDKKQVDKSLSNVVYTAPPPENELIEITCEECNREYVLLLDFEEKSAKLFLDAKQINTVKGYKPTGKIVLNNNTITRLCDFSGGIVLNLKNAENNSKTDEWRLTGNQVCDLLHRESNDNFEEILSVILRSIFYKGLQKEEIYIILDNSSYINLPYSQLQNIANKSNTWLSDICVVN